MKRNRCAILVEIDDKHPWFVSKSSGTVYYRFRFLKRYIRIFGSHSEAKKQLPKWLPEWPDARIVPEGEL